ncbi:MAG: DsbA family protein [Hyphomicrobiales bacterium]|nr:DsbA family protein [Rickettsiales bacterium]MCP5361241.1 DsbA family protein [Hyphomicrobiales bacterium]
MDQGANVRLMFVVVLVLAVTVTVFITREFLGNNATAQSGVVSSGSVNADEVRAIVLDMFRNNPKEIMQAMSEGQQAMMQEEQKQAAERMKERREELENNASDPVVGNAKGDVTIVEFFDYKCGYCKRVAPTISEILASDKNVRFVFKDFPILGPASELLAKASLAVHRVSPEKYFDVHMDLLKRSPGTEAQLKELLQSHGLDADKVVGEMEKPEIMAQIDEHRQLAASIGIRGTPAFIINGEFVPGAIDLDSFRQKIEAARKGN